MGFEYKLIAFTKLSLPLALSSLKLDYQMHSKVLYLDRRAVSIDWYTERNSPGYHKGSNISDDMWGDIILEEYLDLNGELISV